MPQCRKNTKTLSEHQKILENSSAAPAYLSARRRYAKYVWNRTERPSVKLHDGMLVGFYLSPRGVRPMLRQKATSQMEQSFFAHRANIERYERLLQTHLTDHERVFIQRRLDEERRALALLHATDVA